MTNTDARSHVQLEPAFGLYGADRVAVVIDGPNLYGTLKGLGRDADFKAMHAYFSQNSRLKNCNYYVSLPVSDEYNPVQKLVDWLGYNGFRVFTKPLQQHIDEDGRRRVRGSMSVEMALDMAEMASSAGYDRIVLFSGDTNMRKAVEVAQQKGTPVTIVTSLKAVGDDVRWQADHFVEIETVLDIISKPSSRPVAQAMSSSGSSTTLRAKQRD